MHGVKRNGLERWTAKLNDQDLTNDGDQKDRDKESVFGNTFEDVELIVDASAAILARK